VRTIRVALSLAAISLALTGCGAGFLDRSVPLCPRPDRSANVLFLMAQSVPSAAYVPCLTEVPGGWRFGGERIRNGRSEFWMDSDRAGSRAVTVSLTSVSGCDTSKAVEVPPEAGEPPMKRYQEPTVLPPTFSGNSYYVFPGGCVTYHFSFRQGATFAQAVEATQALTFVARALGVTVLASDGLILCGRGVSCPG
jgi:hypothetical protein